MGMVPSFQPLQSGCVFHSMTVHFQYGQRGDSLRQHEQRIAVGCERDARLPQLILLTAAAGTVDGVENNVHSVSSFSASAMPRRTNAAQGYAMPLP